MSHLKRQLYAVWPDGSFCELEEVEEYLRIGFSDDFEITPNNPEDIETTEKTYG